MSDSDHLPVGRHPEPQYVYIVEQGAYSNRGVVGVYVTAEDAMADHPIPADYRYPNKPSARNTSHRGGWQPATDAEPGHLWSNGLDWEDGKYITRYELQGALSRVPQGRDPQPSLVNLYLKRELEAYLDGLTITGDNIGDIRRSLFMPWKSVWNGIVRDETAKREQPAPPASADELGEK